MALPSRKKDSQLQSLHDFYEPLVVLRILGPWVGPRVPRALHSDNAAEMLHSTRRIFLDRLCWVCDFAAGGETVSAIALEQTFRGTNAWLATSHKVLQKVESHLDSILKRLRNVHTLSARSLHELEQEICTRCMVIAEERVRRYIKIFRGFVVQCHTTLQISDPLLDRDLTSMTYLAEMPMELCAAADRFRDSESLKRLSRLISATASPSEWSLLRHYIGRLGSWHRASRSLVEYARMNPEMFDSIQVKGLSTPRAIHAPRVDEFTTLNGALSRMYATEEQANLVQGVQALQRLRGFDLDVEFQKHYRDKNFKPRVHAEAWLLKHFYNNDLAFLENDKYIGCSKPSCYCCNLYFQNHLGGFVQRPTHGNVWTNWQLPPHQDNEKQTPDVSIASAMVLKFRQDLSAQIVSTTNNQPRVLDSTTGLTLSNC